MSGLMAAQLAEASDITWNGAINSDYTNSANWVGGVVPKNADYGDTAVFRENSPGNKAPTIYANRGVQNVKFDNSAGWTFGQSGTLLLRQILSSGVGTNRFTVEVKTWQGTLTWEVASGNTVVLGAGMYLDGANTTTLIGGGTLHVSKAIGGWSGSRKLRVSKGLLSVAASSPTGTSGSAEIASKEGRIRILNTVAGAKALIGSRIIDGVGLGLSVTNIGNGYVEIFVPEPPTLLTIH